MRLSAGGPPEHSRRTLAVPLGRKLQSTLAVPLGRKLQSTHTVPRGGHSGVVAAALH